jgi:hypothetical protein
MKIENGRLLSIDAYDIQDGNLIVPEGVIETSLFVFRGYTNLTSITLPAGITTLGNYAFWGCSGLTTITLPAGLTTISRRAFSGCSSLTTITLPAGLTILDDYAFEGCSSLTTITLPPGIKINSTAFNGCDHLEMIVIDSDDPTQIEAIKAQLPLALKEKVIAKSEHNRQQRRDEDSRDEVSPCDISLQHSNASVLLKVLSGFMSALGATALVMALAVSWTPAVAVASVVAGVALLAGSYGLFKYANNPLAVPVVEEQAALSI